MWVSLIGSPLEMDRFPFDVGVYCRSVLVVEMCEHQYGSSTPLQTLLCSTLRMPF